MLRSLSHSLVFVVATIMLVVWSLGLSSVTTAREEPAETPASTAPDNANTDNTAYLLKSSRRIGSVDLIETLLEASGEVLQINEELEATPEQMEVVAGFRYEECSTAIDGATATSVRKYNLAKAKIKIGGVLKTPELAADRRTVVVQCANDTITLFSPGGMLKEDQFLLVEDLPGCTIVLDRLLPSHRVCVGDSWSIPDGVIQAFLAINAVTKSSVTATLTAVVEDVAMIELVGDIEGICLGAATEMSIKAKLQFDITASRINWVGMVINENRSLSYVGPGMNIAARIQIKISPEVEPQSLTTAAVKDIPQHPEPEWLRLAYENGAGAWRFQYGRNWYLFQDSDQGTVLRMLHQGELVAQCNIADIGAIDPKRVASLEKFASDLTSGLASSQAKVVVSDAYESEIGYKEYRVVLDGIVDDMLLRWVYYMLTDPVGNQMVVAFVIEAKMLEAFGTADADLIETMRIGK